METVSACNVGYSNLSSESTSISAAHELLPTQVVTPSADISRAETTSTMVLRSQARGGHSSATIPEIETRPEVEFPQETEKKTQLKLR